MMPPAGTELPRKGNDSKDEGQQRADDEQGESERAETPQEMRRGAAKDGAERGVAEGEWEEEGGESQEPEDRLREIRARAPGEVADAIPGLRNVGERGVLGRVADDADQGEKSEEDEDDAGDLDGQAVLFRLGLAGPAVPAVRALRFPLFHGGIIAHREAIFPIQASGRPSFDVFAEVLVRRGSVVPQGLDRV